MMSSVALLFEAGLATLMVVLIVYCIKLNKRLALLRNQNAEFADMMVGLANASDRAEQAVQHLKAAGLSAERSLRTAIEDAAIAQAGLARSSEASPRATAPPIARQQQAASAEPSSSGIENPKEPRREKIRRDMLIGKADPDLDKQTLPKLSQAVRLKTREEAEETVLQAIRSARVGT